MNNLFSVAISINIINLFYVYLGEILVLYALYVSNWLLSVWYILFEVRDLIFTIWLRGKMHHAWLDMHKNYSANFPFDSKRQPEQGLVEKIVGLCINVSFHWFWQLLVPFFQCYYKKLIGLYLLACTIIVLCFTGFDNVM